MPVRYLAVCSCVLALAVGEGRALAPESAEREPVLARTHSPIRIAQLFGQQRDEGDLIARIGRLENQIRQLTGQIEELQHRNQQLEQRVLRMQQDTDFRFQEVNPSARTQTPPGRAPSADVRPPSGIPPGAGKATQTPGGRGDAFDPTVRPDAPGAPRPLGTIQGGEGAPPGTVPGGPEARTPGAPLDLGALSGGPPRGGAGPAAPPVLAPSANARDEYDLAYGAILRRDYELADEGFRRFLANHGREPLSAEAQRLVPEAYFWLGESQFQRQRYNDAAETFLDLYNKYPNAVKAPDALLRLGQSLAALGKRDYACASFGQVLGKYPKAPENVRRAVEQEQKRARC